MLSEPQQRILARKFQRETPRGIASASTPCRVLNLICEAIGEEATRDELIAIQRNLHYGADFHGFSGAEDDNELGRIARAIFSRYALRGVTEEDLQAEADAIAEMERESAEEMRSAA